MKGFAVRLNTFCKSRFFIILSFPIIKVLINKGGLMPLFL